MSATTPRRFATAVATVSAGALAFAGAVVPASASQTEPETQPDEAPAQEGPSPAGSEFEPATSGQESLKQMSEGQISAAADRLDMSASAVTSLLEADKAIAGVNGTLTYVDKFEIPEDRDEGDIAPVGDVPGSPEEGSRPDAPFTVYLDFDGATLEGTNWNLQYGEDSIDLPADPQAGDAEYEQEVWARVAEDYRPFNVNVTTADPGEEALTKSSGDDGEYGMTAVINDAEDLTGGGASGYAWIGGFGNAFLSPALIHLPALRPDGTPATAYDVANTVSHEVGHTLGLGHDGFCHDPADEDGDGVCDDRDEYYGGDTMGEPDSLWAPIMGGAFFGPVSQWSNGDYANASNTEDDLAIMTERGTEEYSMVFDENGDVWTESYCTDAEDPNNPGPGDNVWKPVGSECPSFEDGEPLTVEVFYSDRAEYQADDHGDDTGDASSLDNSTGEFASGGTVETNDDADVFSVVTSGGAFSVEATPASVGANLDIAMQLLDADGEVVAESNPETTADIESPVSDRTASGLEASLEEELEGGVYYLRVHGTGQGDPAENTASNGSGYSDYASLGHYNLNGTAEPFDAEPISITAPEDGAEVEASGLEVTGTAEAGAAVTLTAGDDTVGEAEADDQGNWTTTLEGDLPYGQSTITAQQSVDNVDVPATDEVNVVVPVDAPVISKPEDGDTATTATPEFSGEGIPGATVAVQVACGDTTVDGEAEVDDEGAWTFTPEEELPAGECEVTATQTANDVTSSEAGPISFTVDVSGGDENGDESGDAGGNEDGDEDLPDTGAGSSNLLILAGGLALLGMGAALYARTRRGAIES